MKIAIQEDSDTFQKVQTLRKMGFRTPTDVVHEAIRVLYKQRIDEACIVAAKLQADCEQKAGPDMMEMQGLKND